LADCPFRLWELTGDGGSEREQFLQKARPEIAVNVGDFEAITIYRAITLAGYRMSYSDALDLMVWEIAVMLGKADSDKPDKDDGIDEMLKAMQPRTPSPDRKG